MAPIYFLVNRMLQELGIEKVAKELQLSTPHVYKFGQNPDESGKDIPIRHLLTLIELAGCEVANQPLQTILDDLIGIFALPARRKFVHTNGLVQLQVAVDSLKNGKDIKPTVPCPNCGDENFFRRQENGITIEVCRTCFGRGGVE